MTPDFFTKHGLPAPVMEYAFHPKRKWRFDAAWPDLKIALEIEGGRYSGGRHTSPEGYHKDLEKYNEAACDGWRVLKITPVFAGTIVPIDLVKRAIAGDSLRADNARLREELRKQQDNYNHLTWRIDSWRDCISAAQNRERAALAERDGADGACQKLKDSCEVLTQEIARLTKDRDDWKRKHWQAHDDFHRQFLEMENLRQQVASATADVSILRSEKLQLEDSRRGDFRCIVGLTASNQRMAVALSDVLNSFRDDMLAMESVVVTRERKEAWKNALDSWNQYKLDHPTK